MSQFFDRILVGVVNTKKKSLALHAIVPPEVFCDAKNAPSLFLARLRPGPSQRSL